MLARINRETKQHHVAADNDRLAMLGAAADRARYLAFLARIYGFEAPVDSALLTTSGLEEWTDLRDRGHLRLLRSDMQALGVVDLDALPRCSTAAAFRHPAEALGWLYTIERNTLQHGVIERHLKARMPDVFKTAGAYLAGPPRSNGMRFRELGAAMDRLAKDAAVADRIVAAAKQAFRAQHGWYEVAVPPRQRQFAS